MRLLFDENLAGRLVECLQDVYPNSSHVRLLGLGGTGDQETWARAGAEGFVLVTKDEDSHRYSIVLGPPPKVIWIRLGNCRTDDIEQLLRSHHEDVGAFVDGQEAALLELG